MQCSLVDPALLKHDPINAPPTIEWHHTALPFPLGPNRLSSQSTWSISSWTGMFTMVVWNCLPLIRCSYSSLQVTFTLHSTLSFHLQLPYSLFHQSAFLPICHPDLLYVETWPERTRGQFLHHTAADNFFFPVWLQNRRNRNLYF